MDRLSRLVEQSEQWLMCRILHYAKQHGFSPYTSTLEEAWRVSIVGLTDNLVASIRNSHDPVQFTPHHDYSADPGTAFGVLEAERHRARGIDLGMFMGLMKYYRQCYLDLIRGNIGDSADVTRYSDYITRYFDAIELGFVTEWLSFSAEDLNGELQETNRLMTVEKNKYLTIFDSQPLPVILLDADGRIENTNNACSEVLAGLEVSGATYYGGILRGERLPFFGRQLAGLAAAEAVKTTFDATLEIKGEPRHFQVHICKLLDISDKFSGFVVVLLDVTEETRAQEALEYSERVANILLEAPQEFAILTDNSGRVLAANMLARHHLGMHGDEIIGVSWKERTDPRLLEVISTHWEQVIATGETITFEYQQDKEWRSCSIYPIHNDENSIREFAVFIRDITERRNAEAILIEAQRREVELHTLRTAAGTTAHEINNPLTGVIGVFQELLESDDEEAVELARMGLAAAKRIKHSVESMTELQQAQFKPYVRNRMILDLVNRETE